jgi:phosphotransferase system enzyme I (PtsI)
MRIQGIGVSPGLASGKAVVLVSRATTIFRLPILPEDVDAEIHRLDEARVSARRQIAELRERVAKAVGRTYARVFDAHLLMAEDAQLRSDTEVIIRTECVNAEWALKTATERLLAAFDRIDDPYLRERGGDLEDVHSRLQRALAGEKHRHELSELTEDSVIVSHSLSPSDAALLHQEHIVGFCTDVGTRTSHIAILANALNIPAVVGTHDLSRRVTGGDLLLVDGNTGEILWRPSAQEREGYRRELIEFERHEQELEAERTLPSITLDGQAITLMANIEFPEELDTALARGARGIGLYRSEFLYLSRAPALPTEEEHLAVYDELASRCGDEEAIIRTFDLGGDKYFHEVMEGGETNPVMGLRAIRICLRRTDVFRTQLRAVLRASVHRNLKVMFPLVSGVGELRQARTLLEEARLELEKEGFQTNPDFKVGIMVEVPSAALTADRLAREADFFSIGTNDLLQYSLALDRGNESVSYLYQPLHPALLRLLQAIVSAGRAAGIDVSICGEMAGDPLAAPVLIGLGLHKLSMNASAIAEVRSVVRQIEARRAEKVAAELLDLATAEEVEARVREEFRSVRSVRSRTPVERSDGP